MTGKLLSSESHIVYPVAIIFLQNSTSPVLLFLVVWLNSFPAPRALLAAGGAFDIPYML